MESSQILAPSIKNPIRELSLEKPVIIKDSLLLSPGIWNGDEYTEEIIFRAFENTDWEDLSHSHLYLDHKDTKDQAGVGNWAGFVTNPRFVPGEGLFGDLEIWHPLAAVWTKAKPKFGISATLAAPENVDRHRLEDFHFESFSIVHDPACRPALINLSKEVEFTELAKVSNFETVRKKMGIGVSQFYAAPRDPPSSSSLPIFDAAHTRNAMARFNQTKFISLGEKAKAKGKIMSAAKKFGIKISDKFKSLEDSNSSIEENIELEGGQNKDMVEKTVEKKDELSQKVDDLSGQVKELMEKLSKLVSLQEEAKEEAPAEEKPAEEEPKEAPAEEPEEKPAEESSEEAKGEEEDKELENVKKELSSLKKEISRLGEKKDVPVVKTLSMPDVKQQKADVNQAMFDYLKSRVH